jgi:hypothetical protein
VRRWRPDADRGRRATGTGSTGSAPAPVHLRLVATVGLAAAAGYSYVAAGTTPFTMGADLVTAVPFAFAGALVARTLVRRRSALGTEVRPGGPAASSEDPAHGRRHLGAWVIAIGFFVALELASYFAGFGHSRHAFPTLSSLYDSAAQWRAAKAVLFFSWLALGWGLLRR